MAKINGAELFPILPRQAIGIARMAANARHADNGHLIEFKALEVRSILNRNVSRRTSWIAYSINPYRGCEFGCKYCFARYTHEFLQAISIDSKLHQHPAAKTAPEVPQAWATAFEHEIYVKQNAAWLLQQELRRFDPRAEIAIGTATDPYQPIERRARVTRSILEVFAKRSGHTIGIITKSRLIVRDLDILTEVAQHNRLIVHITITTPDAALARMVEPRAPRPDLRFAAVRKLRDAGITAGVMCSPLLPGINDSAKMLDEMCRRAADARASFFVANPLFLKLCSRPTYLSFVREHFPALEADYRARFADRDFAAPKYRRQMAELVSTVRRKYGLGQRSMDVLPEDTKTKKKMVDSATVAVQRRLFA
ncbi:MAG TPA: radical SAM protein [Edaphobacter sp.]|jgi:DNA repair photolyase|nr:radical SAM protein [Edaphobacter sp.]